MNKVRNFVQTGTEGGSSAIAKSFQLDRKVRLTDEQLVIDDFINALNIPQGQKPGKPSYGTTLWSFIFEPNTIDVRQELSDEVARVAALDPRINLNSVSVSTQDSGILVELELAIVPFNQAQSFSIFFDPTTSTAFGS
jgi:phage baseplate assembly protein W